MARYDASGRGMPTGHGALVGGSSRLPGVRARLRSVFGGRELRSSVDPDLAVALGAAASGD
jgi:molecular chaperone DnaK (HSP70)